MQQIVLLLIEQLTITFFYHKHFFFISKQFMLLFILFLFEQTLKTMFGTNLFDNSLDRNPYYFIGSMV